MTARELETIVKGAARKAGIKDWKLVTPHKLRKTFESFLRNQSPEYRLDTKDQEFFMGHILPGSQDNYYDRSKIEDMRAKFSRLIVEQDPALQVLREMARGLDIDLQVLRTELRTELGKEPRESDEIEFLRERVKEIAQGKPRGHKAQKIVEERELEEWLIRGWHSDMTLPSGKIVISGDESAREIILPQQGKIPNGAEESEGTGISGNAFQALSHDSLIENIQTNPRVSLVGNSGAEKNAGHEHQLPLTSNLFNIECPFCANEGEHSLVHEWLFHKLNVKRFRCTSSGKSFNAYYAQNNALKFTIPKSTTASSNYPNARFRSERLPLRPTTSQTYSCQPLTALSP